MRTIGYLKLETPLLYNVSGTQGLNLYRTFQYLLLHHLYVSYLYICIFKNLPILKKIADFISLSFTRNLHILEVIP